MIPSAAFWPSRGNRCHAPPNTHYANLTFDKCAFDGNVAIDGEGGAVWARRAHVTIEGGELLDNNANRYGGAVHAVDGRLKIQGGSRFEGNQANKGGGALFNGRGEPGSNKPLPLCSMTDAAFVSKSVYPEDQHDDDEYGDPLTTTSAGGAALFMLAVVDITNSVFSGNYTANSGEALNGGFETSMAVTGCLFGNNTAGGYGGAILASFMTLGGSTQLTDNTAFEGGGAVNGSAVRQYSICICILEWNHSAQVEHQGMTGGSQDKRLYSARTASPNNKTSA